MILTKLYEENLVNELKSCSINTLHELTDLSITKVRDTIRIFVMLNYIAIGATQGNTKTYYITQEGINKLKSLK
jgi:hypothetical protein